MLHSCERRGNRLYIMVNAVERIGGVFGPSTAACSDGRVTTVVYIYIYNLASAIGFVTTYPTRGK